MWLGCRFLDTEVDGPNPGSISMLCLWARDLIRIASVDSAVKWVPSGDTLVFGGQCYELFGELHLRITHIFIWETLKGISRFIWRYFALSFHFSHHTSRLISYSVICSICMLEILQMRLSGCWASNCTDGLGELPMLWNTGRTRCCLLLLLQLKFFEFVGRTQVGFR